MHFLRFAVKDSVYPLPSEVIVNAASIVKIEPEWWEENEQGKWLIYVGIPDEQTILKGLQRGYRIYDSSGQVYSSHAASPATLEFIKGLWEETQ